MKKILLFVLLAVVLATVVVAILGTASRPANPAPLSSFPLLVRGLALAPPDAEIVVLIPATRALYDALAKHPVTRGSVREWASQSPLPRLRFLVGGAPALAWRRHGVITVAIAANGLRRFAIRIAAPLFGGLQVENKGEWMLVGGRETTEQAPRPAGLGRSEPNPIAGDLEGHFFFFAPHERETLLSPSGTPMFGAVTLSQRNLTVRSRARAAKVRLMRDVPLTPPGDALFSLRVASSDGVGPIERLVGADLSGLTNNGAMFVVYKIEERKLLPRPRGAVIVPASAEEAERLTAMLKQLTPKVGGEIGRLLGGKKRTERVTASGVRVTRIESLGFTIESAFSDGEMVVGFDKSSLERYLGGRSKMKPEQGAMCWSMRISHGGLDLLVAIASHDGLRLLAPELARRLEEISGFGRLLPGAEEIEARSVVSGIYDETTIEARAK